MLTLKKQLIAKNKISNLFIQVCLSSFISLLLILPLDAQVFTTVQDGDWSDSSTWGGTAPGNTLADKTVIINHNVNHNATIKIQKNTILTINNILNLTSGSIELEKLSSGIELNFALLIVANGAILNKKGAVTLADGGIQIGNGNYTDESNSVNSGTLGTGYIYVNNGNIENKGTSPFSSDINWCITSGGSTSLPTSENCSDAEPPGQNYNDQIFYLTILPVELSYFTGSKEDGGCKVELNWASVSEEAFAHYEVQRRVTETQFETLESIKGQGGDFVQVYKFIDYNAGLINYYRLKMVDLDGHFDFSDLILVETDCGKNNTIISYPNPVSNSASEIHIKYLALNNSTRLSINNQLGIEIARYEMNTFQNTWNILNLPISSLLPGMYFIKDLDTKAVNTFIIHK